MCGACVMGHCVLGLLHGVHRFAALLFILLISTKMFKRTVYVVSVGSYISMCVWFRKRFMYLGAQLYVMWFGYIIYC